MFRLLNGILARVSNQFGDDYTTDSTTSSNGKLVPFGVLHSPAEISRVFDKGVRASRRRR